MVAELAKWVLDEYYLKIDKAENIRQTLKEKQEELKIPERSFNFGLEMINHVFNIVIRQIEEEKSKIMNEFKTLIEDHCKKKFEKKASKLHKELDKCVSYLQTTSKALDESYRENNHIEICNEFVSVNYLDKTMKKFEDNIEKAEKYAVFCENDYQFVFHKNDFSKSLKEIIDTNVQFNLTTDKKDSKFQDLGKFDDSSIVYVGPNSQTELSLVHYNMGKMSRAEKAFDVPKDDKFFPISGFRSVSDNLKNLVYMFGGKTDGNYTTRRCYQLKQVNRDEGKFVDIKKMDSMLTSRAYFGACSIEYKKNKYILAAGGQQTQKALNMNAFGKDNSDTVSMSSSGFDVDVPRNCIAECEVYDITNNKWLELPDLCHKKSNTSICALKGTTIVYCFGGWNGKTSVNAIERLNVADYLNDMNNGVEWRSDTGEENKDVPPMAKIDKNYSAGNKKYKNLTWTKIVVKEAGALEMVPSYRLFGAFNSIGCVALDENCILLFGGKDTIKDGETDQCYMFFGANRVKGINPNDHL